MQRSNGQVNVQGVLAHDDLLRLRIPAHHPILPAGEDAEEIASTRKHY